MFDAGWNSTRITVWGVKVMSTFSSEIMESKYIDQYLATECNKNQGNVSTLYSKKIPENLGLTSEP